MASNPEYNLDAELGELQERLTSANLKDEAAAVDLLQLLLIQGGLGKDGPYYLDPRIGKETAILDIADKDSEAVVKEKVAAFALRIEQLLESLPPPVVPKPEPAPAPKPAERRESKLSAEDQRWCEQLINAQYDEAFDTVNLVLNPSLQEVAPTKPEVEAAIFKILTPELVAEIRSMREPVLLIVPNTTADLLLATANRPECMNQGSIINQQAACLDTTIYKPAANAVSALNGVAQTQSQPKITSYRFVITEGKQHFDANIGDKDAGWNQRAPMKNEARMNAFKEYCKSTGMKSLDTVGYMLLMIRGMRKGEPTDRISDDNWNFTLLPGDPIDEHVKGSLVAAGRWYSFNRQALFNLDLVGNVRDRARLRSAVMGGI